MISMTMLGSSDYAYFYEDWRKMYHQDLGEVDLESEDDWDYEARDILEANNICVAGVLEPYASVFVVDGKVVDAQYRMVAISMDV